MKCYCGIESEEKICSTCQVLIPQALLSACDRKGLYDVELYNGTYLAFEWAELQTSEFAENAFDDEIGERVWFVRLFNVRRRLPKKSGNTHMVREVLEEIRDLHRKASGGEMVSNEEWSRAWAATWTADSVLSDDPQFVFDPLPSPVDVRLDSIVCVVDDHYDGQRNGQVAREDLAT